MNYNIRNVGGAIKETPPWYILYKHFANGSL